jgi:prepilin-type N-terminal cleavage/methylation domain-containing protein
MNMKRNRTLPFNHAARSNRRGAFTLVELLVVIAIAAIVTGMTLGGYRSMADGNERVSCQTNLTQIYAAMQLYTKDYDGYYPFYDPSTTLDGTKGLGLWALYGLRSDASSDQIADIGEQFPGSDHDKPIGTYVRNRKLLHCPADADNDYFLAAGSNTQIDMNYLSYQMLDGVDWTYQPWRGVTTDTQWNANRQLLRVQTSPLRLRHVRPVSDAVITWCSWHRGNREIDNVLFVSGAVRPVPKVQTNPNTTLLPGEPTTLEGWNRRPPF